MASGGGEKRPSAKEKKKHAVPSLRDCAWCGAPEGLKCDAHKQCGRCKMTYYCSKGCQKKHWKGDHKQHCRPPPRLLTGAHAQAACAEQASQSPQQSGAQQAPKMGLMNPATGSPPACTAGARLGIHFELQSIGQGLSRLGSIKTRLASQ